jgi:hypothetical protein
MRSSPTRRRANQARSMNDRNRRPSKTLLMPSLGRIVALADSLEFHLLLQHPAILTPILLRICSPAHGSTRFDPFWNRRVSNTEQNSDESEVHAHSRQPRRACRIQRNTQKRLGHSNARHNVIYHRPVNRPTADAHKWCHEQGSRDRLCIPRREAASADRSKGQAASRLKPNPCAGY